MLLKIEGMDGNTTVELDDGDSDPEDTEQLPDCWLSITQHDPDAGDEGFTQRCPLNPYQAEALGNALLRWVKDVTIESDEDLEDDDDDDDDDESELNR